MLVRVCFEEGEEGKKTRFLNKEVQIGFILQKQKGGGTAIMLFLELFSVNLYY